MGFRRDVHGPSWALLVVMLVALGLASCGKAGDGADAGHGTPAALEPVPAPRGLLAEVWATTPEATWTKARALIAAPAMFVPQTFGGLVVAMLGLPITTAAEIDGAVPVLGAVVAPDASGDAGADAGPRGVLALHVKEGGRLVDQLTKGEAPRFAARQHPASSIALLDDKGGRKGPVAIGVLGNYLLVARSEADLVEVGPYVARTMPRAPVPAEEVVVVVPESGMAGPVRAWAARVRAALDPEQRPDTAFASLLAPLQGGLDVLADLESARVTIGLGDTVARVSATVVPRGGGAARAWVDGMAVGDLAPLLGLPVDTGAALLVREPPAMRGDNAKRQADAMAALLGVGVAAKDRDALLAALGQLAEARGPWMTVGLSFGPTGPAGYFRAPVTDEAKLRKGVAALVALVKSDAGKSSPGSSGLRITTGKTKVEGVSGEVERVRFERTDKGPGARPVGLPDSVDLLYSIGKEEMLVAAGLDARGALARVASAKETLAGSALVKPTLDAAGASVAYGLLLEPILVVASRAGRPGAGESAPVLLTVGRGEVAGAATLSVKLDVANAALREAIKHRGAIFGAQ